MKAAVVVANEDVQYQEIEEPKVTKGAVKIKVRYSGICGSDIPRVLNHGVHFYPIVLGHEFSGDVVEVGEGVTKVKVGDRVSGAPLLPCMKCDDCQKGNFSLCKHYSFIGSREQGSNADYVVIPEQNAVVYDPGIPYEQAAMFEPATVAIHGVFQNDYQGGQYVEYAVNGESWTDVPLFIKQGAIIPTQKALNYTSEEAVSEIMLDIFPSSAQSSFRLYDDDGSSYDYESGEYFKQTVTAQDRGTAGVSVDLSARTGSYASSYQAYLVKLHGKAASQVRLGGTVLTKYSDLAALRAASGEGYAVGRDIYGDVTYVKVAAGAEKHLVATGSIAQTADRVLQVSDGRLTDFGRCRE